VSELLPEFPILSLSVSGGHTELWLLESHASRVLLGATLDDAAGEAFDKGANMLGLPYPGGPAIAAAAKQGEKTSFSFPRPRTNNDETNIAWSFSGLKTALKYTIADVRKKEESDCLSDTVLSDLSASYQEAICMHLLDGVRNALTCNPTVRELHIVGGVSANMRLRAVVQAFLSEHHPKILLRVPAALQYCTDNGAMIGAAAYFTHTNTQTLWRTAATFHSPINPRSQAGWM
jgi:N6-L-threonylcarbamoyladenine synthase